MNVRFFIVDNPEETCCFIWGGEKYTIEIEAGYNAIENRKMADVENGGAKCWEQSILKDEEIGCWEMVGIRKKRRKKGFLWSTES